jgi:hypothetical protein
MPERAWTTARAKCAISGLTRAGFTPDHVQINPPCEGPAEEEPCTPPTVIVDTNFTIDMTPPGTGSVTVCAADLDEGSDPAVWWELQVADLPLGEGPDLASCCVNLNCDHLGTLDYTLYGYAEFPGPCFGEASGVITLTDDQGACGVAVVAHHPIPQSTPDNELPRYYIWVELPRTPDFEGGEPGVVWSRDEHGGHL